MKLARMLVGVALATVIVGCNSGPAESAPTMTEAQFMEQARTFAPFAKAPDESLKSSGNELCKAFSPSDREGAANMQERIRGQLTEDDKLTTSEADTLLGYAVLTYCPQRYGYLAGGLA